MELPHGLFFQTTPGSRPGVQAGPSLFALALLKQDFQLISRKASKQGSSARLFVKHLSLYWIHIFQ